MKIPNNLCIKPFIQLATKPSGYTRVCCTSTSSKFIVDSNGNRLEFNSDLNQLWNSHTLVNLRKKFLNNEKPIECQACYDLESFGKKSKRQQENDIYLKSNTDRIIYAEHNNGELNSYPVILDLRFGNHCNLKCRSCFPSSSSLIEKEYNLINKEVINKLEIELDSEVSLWYKDKRFLEKIKLILPELKFLYIVGGEPTIIPEVLKLLNLIIDSGYSKNIILSLNTNLSIFNNKFFSILNKFKAVHIGPSIDIYGDRLKYVRHPLEWKTFKNNYKRLMDLNYDNLYVFINITVSVYNIFHLEELYNKMLDMSNERVSFNFEILSIPSYLSFNILPDHLRKIAIEKIDHFISNVGIKDQLISIKYMLESKDDYLNREKFKLFTNTLDKIRNENFAETFPELKDLI